MSSNESVESSRTVTCEIKSLDDLHHVASLIVKHLPQSALVTLQGELGAGKTTFVKAIADSVEIDPAHVTSPTFNLITIHESPLSRKGHPYEAANGSAIDNAGER